MADEEAQDSEVNVCVAVRCRPMNGREISEGASIIVEFPASSQQVVLHNKKEKHQYAFDHIFPTDSAQETVYETLGVPLLKQAFEGYNSTIFAYGQTGSGKTHTMMAHRAQDSKDRGLIPRISDGLYNRIKELTAAHESRRFLVCCSFLEIYNEIIYDLLVPRSKQAKGGLEVKEQKGIGVYVKDLSEMVVESSERLNQLIEQGFGHRSTAATKMNDASSRSHCIFIIKLHQKDARDESKNTFSKLNLVDLAGSERAKSTEAEGERLKEGANINKSLSALGNVINALSSLASGNKKIFVPYRNSKLTRVLQESLGGNSLCTMVATISPAASNVDETLSTLNYAKRAKTIKVTAVKNDEASQISKLKDEVDALRKKLEMQVSGASQSLSGKEKEELESKYETQIHELQSFMKQSWEEKQRLSEQYEEDQRKVREEAKRAVEQMRKERQNRLQLLEQTGDLTLSLQALKSLGSTLCSGWPERISEALKVEQQLRSQIRAVRLFRESAGADFTICTGCKVSDAVAILTLLTQVQTKLGSMSKELESLSRLEKQLDEQIAKINPEVALSLREAQADVSANPQEDSCQEIVAVITLVQRQLAEQHAKARTFVQGERQSMGFEHELSWLKQCLEMDGASATNERENLLKAIRAQSDEGGAPKADLSSAETQNAGLSTFELPDEQLHASSHVEAARCARLMQIVAYGGWCPATNSIDEYLEVDLGEERHILGLSLQGRVPCTSEWMQTRDLLQLALAEVSDRLPTSEKVFRRPPVRLVHDVGVTVAHEKRCFGSGPEGWEVPQEFLNYNDLSREQKVAFFEELISRTRMAWPNEEIELSLTPQDILSGKNCEESNKFLQLLAYLALSVPGSRGAHGLSSVTPQWTAAWKMQCFTQAAGWKWVGSYPGLMFEGNVDALTVKIVRLPEPVMASRLRIYPVDWHQHVALRCEVHVGAAGATSGAPLEETLKLARKGITEVRRGMEERHKAKQQQDDAKAAEVSALKDKAEQERDVLEKRLQDALAKVDELETLRTTMEERAAKAETALLEMQVDRDRLVTQVSQLEGDVSESSKEKAAFEEESTNLQEECKTLKRSVDDLQEQLNVVTDERDLARGREEELFDMLNLKEEDLTDTNNGYVYLTERLQEKEEELEHMEEKMQALSSGNDALDDRCRELSEESLNLRAENQKLKARLADEERSHKAAQDRYMGLLKDKMASSSRPVSAAPHRPESTSTVPPSDSSTTPPKRAPAAAAAEGGYDEDFDDD